MSLEDEVGPSRSLILEPDSPQEDDPRARRGRPIPRRTQKPKGGTAQTLQNQDAARNMSSNRSQRSAGSKSKTRSPSGGVGTPGGSGSVAKKAKLEKPEETDALLSLESALAASDKDLGSQIEEFSKDDSFGGSTIAGRTADDGRFYDDAWNVTDQEHQEMILALQALEGPEEGSEEPKRMTQEELYAMTEAVNAKLREKKAKAAAKKANKGRKSKKDSDSNEEAADDNDGDWEVSFGRSKKGQQGKPKATIGFGTAYKNRNVSNDKTPQQNPVNKSSDSIAREENIASNGLSSAINTSKDRAMMKGAPKGVTSTGSDRTKEILVPITPRALVNRGVTSTPVTSSSAVKHPAPRGVTSTPVTTTNTAKSTNPRGVTYTPVGTSSSHLMKVTPKGVTGTPVGSVLNPKGVTPLSSVMNSIPSRGVTISATRPEPEKSKQAAANKNGFQSMTKNIPAGISVTKEPPSSPYVTVTPAASQNVYAKKSPVEEETETDPSTAATSSAEPTDKNDRKDKPLWSDDEEEEEEENAVDVVSQAENFQGLNDAQINQLSKKGIAKWYEQKILDMAKGVSKMRKGLVPKSEVEEVKRERAKAVAHEQQRFRQELTTKTSLIDSLKKKLKSLQEKKEKEVVAYAQCAEKLSQRVKTLTAELSKAKTEKLNDQSTVYKEVYKEEIAKLKLKVEEQKKMLDKAGQLQAENAQLKEQVRASKQSVAAAQGSKDSSTKELQKLESFKDKLIKQNLSLKDALTKAESKLKSLSAAGKQSGTFLSCDSCVASMKDKVDGGKVFAVTSAEGDELFLTCFDQKTRIAKFMASQEMRVQGYLSTLKAKNEMISKLLEEVGKGKPHTPTTVCGNCLPWSTKYHSLCAKFENNQSKIAMLEMKAKAALVTKVDRETNTVETGSTARVVVAQDVMQDKTVKEALFNLNTKITRLQMDVTSHAKDLAEETKKAKRFEEKGYNLQRQLHESQQTTRELKANKAKLQHDLTLMKAATEKDIKEMREKLTIKTQELQTATQSMVNLTLKHKEFEKTQAGHRQSLLEEVDARQAVIDVLVSKAKTKNDDFRRRMAWARAAVASAQIEVNKLKKGGGRPQLTSSGEEDEGVTEQLSRCKITADLQDNRISDLEKLLRSNEVNLFKMQVEKSEVSAKLTKSFEDLESIKAVSIRTIKTQVENSEKKWAEVVNNKTKLINKLTKDNQQTATKLTNEYEQTLRKLNKDLKEARAATNSDNIAKEAKIKDLTRRVTIQQNQISIQNQQINNQQQQINSLIMGTSQDVDSLSPPPLPEEKKRKPEPEPEPESPPDKPAGLKKVIATPSGQVQRIQLTKNSQVKQQQQQPQAKDRAKEPMKSSSGSGSSGEELEVVYSAKNNVSQSAAKTPVQSHKLEVKKVAASAAPQHPKVAASVAYTQATSAMQQQGPLTVVRNGAGVLVARPQQSMKLQVTPVTAAATAGHRPRPSFGHGQQVRVLNPAAVNGVRPAFPPMQTIVSTANPNMQMNLIRQQQPTYTVTGQQQQVQQHRLSVSTTSSNNYTYQLSQDGRNLAYTVVGNPSNGNKQLQQSKGKETFVDGTNDVDYLEESSIIDGIPASEILKMAEGGDILSQALASTGVTAAAAAAATEDEQQLLEAISF